MARKKKQINSRLLFLLFALYYANISFFYHSHNVDGTIVVHSHFYNKNHEQNGNHTEKEIHTLTHISAFQSVAACNYVVDEPQVVAYKTLIPRVSQVVNPYTPGYFLLRAPPAAIYSLA